MSIPRVPRFSDRYRIVWNEEGVLISGEDRWVLFKAEPHRRVAPLVDGVRTADEIVDCLAGRVDAARVYYTLSRWARDGYLEEGGGAVAAAPDAPYWRHVGVPDPGRWTRTAKSTGRESGP